MAVNQFSTMHNMGGTAGGGSGWTGGATLVADPDIYAQIGGQRQLADQAFNQKRQLQAERMGTIKPYLDQLMGIAGGQATNMPGPAYGGTQPRIQGGPIWTADAVQGNINANRAQIDRSTATNIQRQNNQLAGRGYGTGSPLAMALQGQAHQSAMGQKADYAREFVPQTRQANAGYALNVGQAQEQQFANRNREANDRRQIQASQTSSLINALGGLIGSI